MEKRTLSPAQQAGVLTASTVAMIASLVLLYVVLFQGLSANGVLIAALLFAGVCAAVMVAIRLLTSNTSR